MAHLAAWSPVRRRSNPIFITELQRVNAAQDLIELTTSRSGVLKSKADLLCWVDDEDAADGEWNALLVNVGQVLLVEHVLFDPTMSADCRVKNTRHPSRKAWRLLGSGQR